MTAWRLGDDLMSFALAIERTPTRDRAKRRVHTEYHIGRLDLMLCAISPGLIDTGASRPYFADMSRARSPEAAAEPLLAFVLAEAPDSRYYRELVHLGKDRGAFGSNAGFGDILPWK
jgi:hypothetical protein